MSIVSPYFKGRVVVSVSFLTSIKFWRLVVLALLATTFVLVAVYHEALDTEVLQNSVQKTGAIGPIVFMLVYALGTVCFLPGPLFVLVGGALFGPLWGTFYSVTGVMAGAAISFIIARFLASNWIEARVGGLLKKLKAGIEAEGWRFVVFVRLVPVIPATVLNYTLGLTRIKFSHFFIASYLAKIPSVAAYAYVGYAGKEAITGAEDLLPKVLIGLAILGIIAFLPYVIRRLRNNKTAQSGA